MLEIKYNGMETAKTNGKYYKKIQIPVDVQGATGSSPVPSTRQEKPETTRFQAFFVILTKDTEHRQTENTPKVMKSALCFIFLAQGAFL